MSAPLIPYKSIENPASNLVVGEGLAKNAYDIFCPREGCRSIVLKKGAATWMERDSLKLALPTDPPSTTTDGPPTQPYWVLTNMMDFENIGFSHTVDTTKYLSCADCDIGPLGYHDLGAPEKEYLIAVERVRYRRE
ncbi:rab interactin-like proteing factor [Jimgerdemannia flammicorona]|uniref:Rab interactin-like proteing factor n=1 Tax=Jimgerdemannia flammicorona TaxID=994334 RepID=A0A433QGF5_9FUNG|nr:rab interactin-like proteing factor [Jimgerdemannia flammicorona]